jgi:hypothetical protein
MRSRVSAPLNRGAEQLDASVDWLTATTPLALERARTWLEDRVGPLAPARRSHGYRDAIGTGDGSVRLLSTPGRQDLCIDASGVGCRLLGEQGVRSLLALIISCGGHATRIDLALTDLTRAVELDLVFRACARELRTRAQVVVPVIRRREWRVGSIYIGSPTSRRQLLIYDKTAESRGRLDAVRWELRLKKAAAQSAAKQLSEAGCWGPLMAGLLVDFVDFRGGSGERVPWFQAIVGRATGASVYESAQPTTLNREWLVRTAGPQMARALIEDGGDMDFVFELVSSGRERLRVPRAG